MIFDQHNFKKILSQHTKQKIKNENLIKAAVLLPIYNLDGEYHLLFTKRTEMVDTHKGDISFPGGVYHEEDKSLLDTALRATNEELGISPEDVEILGELDDIETNTNFIISPFVGIIPYPYEFKINDMEIERLIQVPLEFLLNEENFWKEVRNYKDKNYTIYFYRYEDNIIWGATAKILKDFLDLLR